MIVVRERRTKGTIYSMAGRNHISGKAEISAEIEQNREVVSIDDLPEQMLEWQETGFDNSLSSGRDFDFEEEKLATAFAELPLMKKEILRLLFVEELDPDEIAEHLNCSVQHVYNQRSLALKKLRGILAEGGMINE